MQMVESLRSLPGAFRVTPNFTPNGSDAGENHEDDERQQTPPVPEHDIAVEAYAVHDTTTNNNVSLGNRDEEDLEQPPVSHQTLLVRIIITYQWHKLYQQYLVLINVDLNKYHYYWAWF